MKMIIYNVTIANSLDDSTRNEIFISSSNDVDINNYISEFVEMEITLNEWSEERIIMISKIDPSFVCSNEFFQDSINEIKKHF
jgi:hypothetical protein